MRLAAPTGEQILGVLASCLVDCFEVGARVVVLSFVGSDYVPIFPEDGRRVVA